MKTTAIAQLTISSPAFGNEENIPSKYTCNGDGINPPLEIKNIPEGTQTLAIIVEDPDAPNGIYDHWVVWNIKPTNIIPENSNPGISGNNSAGKTGYHPPCPPTGTHRYYFHVFALDHHLDLIPGGPKEKLQEAMEAHILASGTIIGTYKRLAKL
ncbi:YbhB/YbcL family Raf kinase inhibitor-like protein [Longitalea luteola]|uniref:YbhB/YbcL family Raf kinase inhibitor-like protein n=1 Tax=Longitalea luteola TaxID=2812563 RepID=UPI001A95E656|nr:YbhB/YbcL family Raf kinase inhibitor-like protein [Longitalea luteola]